MKTTMKLGRKFKHAAILFAMLGMASQSGAITVATVDEFVALKSSETHIVLKAGTTFDLSGNRRVRGKRVDLGCYECQLSKEAGFIFMVLR